MAAQQSLVQQPETIAAQIEGCFESAFYDRYRTRLVGGADEPEYIAHQSDGDAIIRYRENFAASALHEVAHWCIAGERRRQLNDYGYWYSPDGRDAEAQRQFEQVEARPQALEYLFTTCCDLPFRLSVDNLALPEWDCSAFAASVWHQFAALGQLTADARAAQFADVLATTLFAQSWQHCWQQAMSQPARCFQEAALAQHKPPSSAEGEPNVG